jgi:hypothetical protein
METTTTTVIENLRAGTQELKTAYFEATDKYASKSFEDLKRRLARPSEDWYTEYKVKTSIKKDCMGKDYTSFEHNRNYYKMKAAYDRLRKQVIKGYEAYHKKLMEQAHDHYEDSLVKLAHRIKAKGLNEDTLTVHGGRMGQNIETIISDGTKSVRAFTIHAGGDIQRPHYRYLVK